jgi:hypothetical protein
MCAQFIGVKPAVYSSIVGIHELTSHFPIPPASKIYDRGGGVGRALGVGRVLGVGLGLGVEVGVGVGVAVAVAVAVGVAVAVAVGVAVTLAVAVAVGVGVPPPPGAWISTMVGDPVLKKPTVALALCGG